MTFQHSCTSILQSRLCVPCWLLRAHWAQQVRDIDHVPASLLVPATLEGFVTFMHSIRQEAEMRSRGVCAQHSHAFV